MSITITASDLWQIAPQANAEIIQGLVAPLNTFLPQFDIVTPARVAMFLAQWAEETDGFKTFTEYATGREYEGRKDLGNVEVGDGARFKGRGLPMLTGRDNYQIYGAEIGINLVAFPERMLDPVNGVRVACLFWQKRGLNAWADKGDIVHCTYLINGGQNGLASRQIYYARAKSVVHGEVAPIPAVRPAEPPTAPGPIAVNPTPPIWQTPEGGMFGSAIVGQLGMIFSGATGPLAWALTFAIVVAIVIAAVYFIKRLHKGQ